METRFALRRDDRGVVDHVHGQERDRLVAVEPLVELGGAQRERRHRHAVEHALGAVGDLARLVQPHQAGGEHLRMDAEATEPAGGQLAGHHVGDRPDPGLQCRPLGDVAQCVCRDRGVHVVWRGLGQRKGDGVRLDEHVHQLERNGVVVLRGQAGRARQVRVHLHDEEAPRVLPGPEQLGAGGPEMQRQVDPPGVVRRRTLGHHDAGREAGQDRSELAEPAGDELHAVPLGE